MAKSTGELMQLETEKYVLQGCVPILVKKFYLQPTRSDLSRCNEACSIKFQKTLICFSCEKER